MPSVVAVRSMASRSCAPVSGGQQLSNAAMIQLPAQRESKGKGGLEKKKRTGFWKTTTARHEWAAACQGLATCNLVKPALST